jgi:hypothetical protein
MQIEHFPVSKGPDRWTLAESLFHAEDFPGEAPRPSFTATIDGEEARLVVTVETISRRHCGEEVDGYRIKGICKVTKHRPRHEVLYEQVPIEISYSPYDRKGFAQISF